MASSTSQRRSIGLMAVCAGLWSIAGIFIKLIPCRTAIGKMGGALSNVPTTTLGTIVIKEALKRANVAPEQVDEVIMGCVYQAGQGQNVARQSSVYAGIPVSVPAFTLNNLCGSALKSVNVAAALIEAGEADIIVAGGMESMSGAPYLLKNARFGYRMVISSNELR